MDGGAERGSHREPKQRKEKEMEGESKRCPERWRRKGRQGGTVGTETHKKIEGKRQRWTEEDQGDGEREK
jgi:hypothetical protein